MLLTEASSHHAVLLLPEPNDPNASLLSASELHRHFKLLIKALRVGPDYAIDYPSSANVAEEALCHAIKAYDALTALLLGTFWTAYAGCRLFHKFERKYAEYRLICPSCHRTFLAVEVPPLP
ncbi:unnamed protein product [Miscanthus lutarioriparius]|uniref:Uncharacterized protein n=1 Tax=Miscanthus lutarioriparius TaxID=422564 RepID=A0A811PDU3_9POAL|nr:unnamed protein product [Miscanthus lutarioriparius]